MHISKFCQCNWAIILQQAWSMCLKDKVRQFGDDNRPAKNIKKGGEPCCRFNKGKCTYGSSCKFDHQCSVKKCSKFGHRAHICRIRDSTDSGAMPGGSMTTGDQNKKHS